jgi:hypothetical protein
MPEEKLRLQQLRTAVTDPGRLKAWLVASNRKYLVLHGVDLVDALAFPDGLIDLQNILSNYLERRRQIETGRTVNMQPVFKDEVLEVSELSELLRQHVFVLVDRYVHEALEGRGTDLAEAKVLAEREARKFVRAELKKLLAEFPE